MKLDPKLQAQLGQMFASPVGENELSGVLLMVDIENIKTASQPRKHFDEAALRDLENSIRELSEKGKGIGGSGLLQPLLVRAGDDGTYIVTAGERRLRASKSAGLKQIPVVVDSGSENDAWEQAIIENLLRADLSPLEEGAAIHTLMESQRYSVREAARRLGKDKGYLENRLFLFKAPDDVKEMVSARADTLRHAREIVRVENPKSRRKLIEAAIAGATLAVIQERVQNTLTPKPEVPAKVSARADTLAGKGKASAFTTAQSTIAGAIANIKSAVGEVSPNPKARTKLIGELEKQMEELRELIEQLRL